MVSLIARRRHPLYTMDSNSDLVDLVLESVLGRPGEQQRVGGAHLQREPSPG